MSEHDFTNLIEQYPTIIAQMPPEFTSHDFILRLAQQNQALYIEALYVYRQGNPFQVVHGILAKQLHQHPDLIVHVGDETHSVDIFGQPGAAARWRRL